MPSTHQGATLFLDDLDGSQAQTILGKLIEKAIRYHPSIRARQQELEGANYASDAAYWQRFPTLSVLSERSSPTGSEYSNTLTTSILRFEQPLWTGGRLTAGINAARERQGLARWTVQDAKWNVVLQTIQAWQNAWAALGRLKTQQHLLRELNKLEAMIQRRVAQQVTAPVDAQLIQTRLIQAQSDLSAEQTVWLTALDSLTQWAGPEAVQPLRQLSANGVESPVIPDISDIPSVQAVQAAVTLSPRLRKQEALIAASRQGLAQKQAALWPTVYARFDRTFTHNSQSGIADGENNAIYVGARYSTDAGLSLRSELKSAESEIAALESDQEALRLELTQSYLALWQQFQSNVKRAHKAASIQAGNDELYHSYTRLFVAGRRSWLELLNILRDQSVADQNYADLLAQLVADESRLRLYMNILPWQLTETTRNEAR